MPQPYVFPDKEKLFEALDKGKRTADTFFSERRDSISELVIESVGSNTFRAFHIKKFGCQPSKLYRDWATAELTKHLPEFRKIRSSEDHQKFLRKRVGDLENEWADATRKKAHLGFGRAAKLINLSLKFLLKYRGIKEEERRRIIPHLDVPLD